MTSAPAVEAIDLVKKFDDNTAVDGVSFVVPEGSVLGLLGPNGAGKTTLVRMLTTLSVPTSGTGRVAGHDIIKEPDEEADHLADEIIVIDKGKVIAAGTPTQLKDRAGAASVVLTLTHSSDLTRAEALMRTCSPEVHADPIARRLTAMASGLGDMTRIGTAFEASGIPIDDVGLKRPSLDDVFLHLTGHTAKPPADRAAVHPRQDLES